MDGKKKRNRKKKVANPNKPTDDSDAAPNGEEAAAADSNHGSGHERNHQDGVRAAVEPNHVPAAAQNHRAEVPRSAESVGVSESDVETERHKICEARWTKLQEEVKHLEVEKSLWIEKEAYLEEKLKLLQDEVVSCVRNEASLEENLKGLQAGSDSSLRKQVILEEKIKHIEDIESSWNLKEVILEEKIKHIEDIESSWNLKEVSIKEMIARLDEVNIGFQLQVSELKEFRDSLLQENQQLKESIPVLESRIQHLERYASFSGSSVMKIVEMPEEKNLIYQAEATHELVDDLDTENAVLDKVAHELHDEKVNEVHIGLNQHDIAIEPSTAELSNVTEATRAATSNNYTSDYDENYRSFERAHETFNIHHGTEDYGSVTRLRQGQLSELDESRISEDVVSVPLDDIQVHDSDLPAMRPVESSLDTISDSQVLPLSDAPLIGAPFRLISYFAKYVSGADLVNQNRSSSG